VAVTVTNNTTGAPSPTYTWSATPPGATFSPSSNGVAPNIYFPSAGNYTITMMASNGATSTASGTVTIIAAPVLTVTPLSQTVCPGIGVSYTATGATTYTWSNFATGPVGTFT